LRQFTETRREQQDRFVDVRFADVVADPVAAAERVTAELGLPADRAAFTAYVARDREQRHGKHTYTAADFGLTEEGLARDFAFYEEVTS
jgi:hypothetical protein